MNETPIDTIEHFLEDLVAVSNTGDVTIAAVLAVNTEVVDIVSSYIDKISSVETVDIDVTKPGIQQVIQLHSVLMDGHIAVVPFVAHTSEALQQQLWVLGNDNMLKYTDENEQAVTVGIFPPGAAVLLCVGTQRFEALPIRSQVNLVTQI